ncbi:MAG: winged helix-turn-helix domain-containing protein [Turicibacter sp.]|nr:winged helix-turn-helix domain-containing protein [Turicibacter sp.]
MLIYQPKQPRTSALIFSKYLDRYNFAVIYATDDDVEQKIKDNNYDIAILDYYKEVGDLSLIDLVHVVNKDRPIVFVTDFDYGNYEVEAYKKGIDGFILRPYNTEALIYLMLNIVRRCRRVARQLQKENYIASGCLLDFEGCGLICVDGDFYMPLAPIEFEIMKLIFAYWNEGFIPKSVILDKIYGDRSKTKSRILDVRMVELRKKLANTGIGIETAYDPPFVSYKLFKKRG